uniref:Uncharacterized protein n=1 Tax=Ixodes ricinus TaxID=34613 RepID=A0A0K8RBX8_IXORI
MCVAARGDQTSLLHGFCNFMGQQSCIVASLLRIRVSCDNGFKCLCGTEAILSLDLSQLSTAVFTTWCAQSSNCFCCVCIATLVKPRESFLLSDSSSHTALIELALYQPKLAVHCFFPEDLHHGSGI